MENDHNKIERNEIMSSEKWNDYTLTSPGERRDACWTQCYAFKGTKPDLPRVITIGDSICNFYHPYLKDKLADKASLTYWATSMCVTDPLYIRELDVRLDMSKYKVISFNNGLHSLYTEKALYDEAYEKCVDFIMAKCPDSKLYLTTSTPLSDPKLTAIAASLNETVKKVAEARNLPVIDLFSLMDPLDRSEYWMDPYHHTEPGREMQAEVMAKAMIAGL